MNGLFDPSKQRVIGIPIAPARLTVDRSSSIAPQTVLHLLATDSVRFSTALNGVDSVSKKLKAVALWLDPIPGPVGMLSTINVPFRVWHHPQNPPSGITYPSYMILRTVGIGGIGWFAASL